MLLEVFLHLFRCSDVFNSGKFVSFLFIILNLFFICRNYKCEMCSQDCRIYSYRARKCELIIITCHQLNLFSISDVTQLSLACLVCEYSLL